MSSRTVDKIIISDDFTHPLVAKCYGNVSFSGSDTTLSNLYPASGISASRPLTNRRRITIPEMANTDYIVFLSSETTNEPGDSPLWIDKTTTTFDIRGIGEASGRTVSFVVYGELA